MVAMDSAHELGEGDELPHFELEGVDGETHTPEDYADHGALLLVVTCNHCPYAQAKFDLLNELADEYDDLAVVGVNPNDETEYPDDSMEAMREFVDEGRVDYDAYLRDDTQAVAAALGATCTPDPYLFRNSARSETSLEAGEAGDDDGTFRLAYHGRLDDALNPDDEPTRYHVREAVDAVLAGEDVDLDWEPSRGCSVKWRAGNEPDYWDDL